MAGFVDLTGTTGVAALGTMARFLPSAAGTSMLITVGWAALAAVFSFSIAMVIWGRNGDNVLPF
jgi:cytochrome b6-f complex subunit 8